MRSGRVRGGLRRGRGGHPNQDSRRLFRSDKMRRSTYPRVEVGQICTADLSKTKFSCRIFQIKHPGTAISQITDMTNKRTLHTKKRLDGGAIGHSIFSEKPAANL